MKAVIYLIVLDEDASGYMSPAYTLQLAYLQTLVNDKWIPLENKFVSTQAALEFIETHSDQFRRQFIIANEL